MSRPLKIAPVRTEHAAATRALRLRALAEHPLAFRTSSDDEARRSVQDFADDCEERLVARDAGLLGAWRADVLVGMAGFRRDGRAKVRHKVRLGGVYVAPEARGSGVGDALVSACLECMRGIPDATDARLSVGASNRSAQSLYLRHGFRVVGSEPRAIHLDGAFEDEVHMELRLFAEQD